MDKKSRIKKIRLFWSGLREREKTTKCCFLEEKSPKQGTRQDETCEAKTCDYATGLKAKKPPCFEETHGG